MDIPFLCALMATMATPTAKPTERVECYDYCSHWVYVNWLERLTENDSRLPIGRNNSHLGDCFRAPWDMQLPSVTVQGSLMSFETVTALILELFFVFLDFARNAWMIALRAQSQRKRRYIVSAGNGFHINTHRAFKYKSTKAIIKSYFERMLQSVSGSGWWCLGLKRRWWCHL